MTAPTVTDLPCCRRLVTIPTGRTLTCRITCDDCHRTFTLGRHLGDLWSREVTERPRP